MPLLFFRDLPLLQEVFSVGSECVNQHTGLQTHASVNLVRSNIIAVSCLQDFLLSRNGQLELPAGYIRCLRMWMLVGSANASFLERYLDNHQVVVIPHNLACDTFSRRFPRNVRTYLPTATRYCSRFRCTALLLSAALFLRTTLYLGTALFLVTP